jgi:hypothetical protein
MSQKIIDFFSNHKKEIIIIIFIFLISGLSFGLGYLVASQITSQVPIIFEKCSQD